MKKKYTKNKKKGENRFFLEKNNLAIMNFSPKKHFLATYSKKKNIFGV